MTDKIQFFSQIIIVHLIGKAHIIVGNKMVRAVFADNIGLLLHEIHNQVRTEAFPVQHSRGVLSCHGNPWSKYFRKFIVLLAPEGIAPGFIQAVHCTVFLFEPSLEVLPAAFAHTQIMMAVSQLIVRLPSDDIRIIFIMNGHSGHNFPHKPTVYGIGLAVMVTPPKASYPSLPVHRKNLRIAVCHPGRRSSRRRSHNRPDSVAAQQVDGIVQPCKVILSFLRFQLVPGKFSHSDYRKPHLLHQFSIGLPPISLPVFRVIINSKMNAHSISSPLCIIISL